MDRFNSNEDAPAWSSSHFNAGRRARLAGVGHDAAPAAAAVGEFARKSWFAGWNDAAMGQLAEAECERHIAEQPA